MEHTKTTWKIDEFGVVTGGPDFCTSIGETSLIKWSMKGSGLTAFMDEDVREQLCNEAKANGEFIVRACNSFDDLLEACKEAEKILHAYAGYQLGPHIEEAMNKCQKAIQKASQP